MPTRGVRGEELAELLLEMSDELEGSFRREFLRQIETLSGSKVLKQLLDDIETGAYESGDPIDVRLNRISIDTQAIDKVMRNAIARSAKITQDTVGLEGSFNVTNPDVINAARNLSVQLSTNLNAKARQTIRDIVQDAVEGNITRVEAANRIKRMVGLLPQHAKAVDNYLNRMLADGVKKSLAKKRADKYAERLLRYRADTIARTEIARSVGIGQTEYWKQMKSEGLLPPEARRVWITASDERVCGVCGPMDGVLADIDGFFETSAGPSEYPQASHPRCRCTAGITMVAPKKRSPVKKEDELALALWLLSKANPYKDALGRFTTKAKAVAPRGSVAVRPYSPRIIPKDALLRFVSEDTDEEVAEAIAEDQSDLDALGASEDYPEGHTMTEHQSSAVFSISDAWINEFVRSEGIRKVADDLISGEKVEYWASEERLNNPQERNEAKHGELVGDVATTIQAIREAPQSVVWRGLRLTQESVDALSVGAIHTESLATATGRKNLASQFTEGKWMAQEQRDAKGVRVLLKIKGRNIPIGTSSVNRDSGIEGIDTDSKPPLLLYADERFISGKFKVVSKSVSSEGIVVIEMDEVN